MNSSYTPSFQDRGGAEFWIGHSTLDEETAARLKDARSLRLDNVKVPADFYQRLPRLAAVEVQGGSAKDLVPLQHATHVRRLAIMYVRGVSDVSWLSQLVGLESLSLYSLAQVEALPSVAALSKLRFLQLGQMVRLHDLAGAALAPALEELRFTKRLGVSAESMRPFVDHPTLARFGWWWDEGVPMAKGRAVLKALPLPRPDWDAPDIGRVTFTDAD